MREEEEEEYKPAEMVKEGQGRAKFMGSVDKQGEGGGGGGGGGLGENSRRRGGVLSRGYRRTGLKGSKLASIQGRWTEQFNWRRTGERRERGEGRGKSEKGEKKRKAGEAERELEGRGGDGRGGKRDGQLRWRRNLEALNSGIVSGRARRSLETLHNSAERIRMPYTVAHRLVPPARALSKIRDPAVIG
ncbi:hypothetical protein K440DRAFT_662052 [Wilcoxina mikolae CBS 423.85]|nr:hypothetical protein K440DRAFT_662052 [Wilcoxina mikolae CBS 423.85]